MKLEDVRDEARKKLKGVCGVYKICDGADNKVCQGHSYGKSIGMGGIGSGESFKNNIQAFKKLKLKMKIIDSNIKPDTTTSLFGKDVTMPIYGAPATGVNSFGGVISELDYAHATVKGCQEAGTIAFRGDTYTVEYKFDQEPYPPCYDCIKSVNGHGVKIFKPRAQEIIIEAIKYYEDIGTIALGTDIDGAGSTIMPSYGKPLYKKSEEDLKELINATKLPFIIKGVMCVEDASIAVDSGAAAIVVSNNGGRVLDSTPGTADVLPEIVDAVGDKILVLIDGGIRTGFDVIKGLALGAKGVLIGRDIIRASVGGGIQGVKLQMEYLQKTLTKAMLMTGCNTLEEINSEIIIR